MLALLTYLKATKVLIASAMFHHSLGSSGLYKGEPHFYDDPTPGDSFPPNLFDADGHGAGGSHAGTYRGL
jgi:hypothetical protein